MVHCSGCLRAIFVANETKWTEPNKWRMRMHEEWSVFCHYWTLCVCVLRRRANPGDGCVEPAILRITDCKCNRCGRHFLCVSPIYFQTYADGLRCCSPELWWQVARGRLSMGKSIHKYSFNCARSPSGIPFIIHIEMNDCSRVSTRNSSIECKWSDCDNLNCFYQANSVEWRNTTIFYFE